MPSEKILEQKKSVVAELTETLKNAAAAVIVDYKGITVAEDTTLRKQLREAGVNYFVVKNSLLRFAIKSVGYEELDSVLEGTTAIAVSQNDALAASKILCKFADSKKGTFSVKAGFSDGKIIDAATINELAKLPSKEVLVAQVLGGLNAPIASLAIVLKAIAEKQSEEQSA